MPFFIVISYPVSKKQRQNKTKQNTWIQIYILIALVGKICKADVSRVSAPSMLFNGQKGLAACNTIEQFSNDCRN